LERLDVNMFGLNLTAEILKLSHQKPQIETSRPVPFAKIGRGRIHLIQGRAFRAILLPTWHRGAASKELTARVFARHLIQSRRPDANTNQLETVTNDEQMVERALSGDPEAFGEIVRRWERRIFALSYGMLGREEDARDATQETFLAAFRNLRGFRGEAKVSSWLHRIAVNQCITRQRRAKVRGETALEDEAEKNAAVFALPLDVSPARTAEKVERSIAVRRAVGSLPPDLRQVIVMKEFEELTFQQISEVLELPLSTVKSRLYTALRQLQMRLQKFGE
jgi:RNA polymerase sigma-70 factor (ECF subfamily)